MKALRDLATKPQLVALYLDSEEIQAKYGDSLEFYIQDRMTTEQYAEISSMDQTDTRAMFMILKDLILDAEGMSVLDDERSLPTDLLVEAVQKITEHLGN
jgi:hypothetical protein